ncbi:hypothetical protein SO802_027185 [Lithocarpus litseifolius]|uniref:Uncharacterized protein n=1 Tax=Lithocarpus litseifolius TaxID=425828 RepID=A0AAW2C572_9ROSI
MRSVFMSKNAAQWLMNHIDHIVVGESSRLFFTFREGDTTFTLQRSTNSFGQFLLLTELKAGGSRRSVIIPEGITWGFKTLEPLRMLCKAFMEE